MPVPSTVMQKTSTLDSTSNGCGQVLKGTVRIKIMIKYIIRADMDGGRSRELGEIEGRETAVHFCLRIWAF